MNLKTHIETVHRHHDLEKLSSLQGMETITKAVAPCDKQESTTDALVDLIIDENLAISWPEKQSVRKFMRAVTPRWKPVCKKTVRSKIIKKGKPFEFNYQTYKCRYGKPSATLDLWTSRARLGFMVCDSAPANKKPL